VKAPSMKELTALAREHISPEHLCVAAYYPRGVACGTKRCAGVNICIRTGDADSAKTLMRAAILEVGKMRRL